MSLDYRDVVTTSENNGKWFLVRLTKDHNFLTLPCIFYKFGLNWGFYTILKFGSGVKMANIKPPMYFIDSIKEYNPFECQTSTNKAEIEQSKESENSNELVQLFDLHNFVDSQIIYDLHNNINQIFENIMINYIEKNQVFEIGDKVKHLESEKLGVIKDIIFSRDGVRYVCNLIRKDGMESTNLMTTKKGNLAEELMRLDNSQYSNN